MIRNEKTYVYVVEAVNDQTADLFTGGVFVDQEEAETAARVILQSFDGAGGVWVNEVEIDTTLKTRDESHVVYSKEREK